MKLDGINGRFDITEEEISEHLKTIENSVNQNRQTEMTEIMQISRQGC